MSMGTAPAGSCNEDWNIAVQPSSLSDGVLQRYQQTENDALGWSVTLVDFASDQRGDLTDLTAVLHRVDAWREGESDANLVITQMSDDVGYSNIDRKPAGQTVRTESGQYTPTGGRID